MIKTVAFIIVGLAAGVGGVLAYQRLASQAGESGAADASSLAGLARSAAAADRKKIVAQGKIEPAGGITYVASPLVGHEIKLVHVAEGAVVNKDDVLVELDNAVDQLQLEQARVQLTDAGERQQAEIANAKQALASATLAESQLKQSRDAQLNVQQSKIHVLEQKVKQAEADLKRLQNLQQSSDPANPLASKQQIEQQGLLLAVAQSEYNAAITGLEQLKQSLDFQEQNAQDQVSTAELALRLAEKGTGRKALELQVQLAELKLAQTLIKSPLTGTILNVSCHRGEVVPQGPLLQIADLDNLVALAEVDASDIQHLSRDRKAKVTSFAFAGYPQAGVEGDIVRFGSLVTPAGLQPLDPRQRVDRHVVQVVVSVKGEEVLKKIFDRQNPDPSALVGLQVEVHFPIRGANSATAAP